MELRVDQGVQPKRQYHWVASIPFFLVHVVAVAGVAYLGWSWKGFALAIALYYIRMFGVTGGYHRYFSHHTYRTSRAFPVGLIRSPMRATGFPPQRFPRLGMHSPPAPHRPGYRLPPAEASALEGGHDAPRTGWAAGFPGRSFRA